MTEAGRELDRQTSRDACANRAGDPAGTGIREPGAGTGNREPGAGTGMIR